MKRRTLAGKSVLIGFCCFFALAGCLAPVGTPSGPSPAPPASGTGSAGSAGEVTPAQAARLERLMIPLLRAMDDPVSLGRVEVGVVEDPSINAGNAGGGRFIVTTGLLNQAGDRELEAVLAHEVAHEDLGHVAKTQTLGAGLQLATVLLDEFFPGSGQFTPIAGNLLIKAYTRQEEYAADRHGVVLLRRIGSDGREQMIDALVWLRRTAGSSPGGFFSTHPGTDDRIERLRDMR